MPFAGTLLQVKDWRCITKYLHSLPNLCVNPNSIQLFIFQNKIPNANIFSLILVHALICHRRIVNRGGGFPIDDDEDYHNTDTTQKREQARREYVTQNLIIKVRRAFVHGRENGGVKIET